MKLLQVLLTLIIGFTIMSCSSENRADRADDQNTGVLRIVATTGMITDIAKNVGGTHVKAQGLMGPGVDPHLYKASAGDVSLLSKADLILYNGLHLEGKMSEVFEQMNKRGIKTVAVAHGTDKSLLLTPPEFKGNYDPHVWFDVSLWMTAVETVKDELIRIDPDNQEDYRTNTYNYLKELVVLNEYVKTRSDSLPADKRVLITAHDAFNYFGKGYGFEVKGLQGISTESEAGTGDVQDLAMFIVERQIPAVFVESSVPPRYIEAVRAAVLSKGFNVKIGGELFSDAMGNPGTAEGNYIGMVRHNIDTIVGALNGGGES